MQFVKDIIKGVLIGIANAVPGVSGGTMMVSMGVYDNIIYCITHLFSQWKKSIRMLLPYIVGMMIGIVGLAFAIEYLYREFPLQTGMTFIGLVLGGVPVLWKRMRGEQQNTKLNLIHGFIFLLFFAAILAMQYFGTQGTQDVTLELGVVPIILLFLVGIVASATMVIPGVSGSMMLMIMGYYYPIINSITTFIKSVTSGDFKQAFQVAAYLVPFGIGVVLGIFVIAKLIEYLFAKFASYTYCAILGLVIASPVVILMGTPLIGVSIITILAGIVMLIIGGLVALKLGD